RSVDELAAETGMHAPSLSRIMRALASVGVFATDSSGKYRLTEVGELLRTGVPGSLRGLMDFCGAPWEWQPWSEMIHSIKTGQPTFNHVFGEGCFDYLAKHPQDCAVFDEAMTGFSGAAAKAVVEAFDFSGIESIVDIGGGHGYLLTTILAKYPKAKG